MAAWFFILIYFWKSSSGYTILSGIFVFSWILYWLYDLLKQLSYRVTLENGVLKGKGLFTPHREMSVNAIQAIHPIYYFNYKLREAKGLYTGAYQSQMMMLAKLHNALAGLFYGNADRMIMINFDKEPSKIPFPAQPINPKIIEIIKTANPTTILETDLTKSAAGTFFGRFLLLLLVAILGAAIYAFFK